MSGILIATMMRSAEGAGVTYAVWDSATKGSNISLSGGNLTVSRSGSGAWESVRTTIGKSSGKWYWEVTLGSGGGGENDFIHGAADTGLSANSYVGSSSNSTGFQDATAFGQPLRYRNGANALTGGATWTTGDVIGIALNMDNGKIWFSKNGTWQGSGSPDPATDTSPQFTGITGTQYGAASLFSAFSATANFGATSLASSPPSGFNAGLYT